MTFSTNFCAYIMRLGKGLPATGFYWDLWCLLTNWYLLVSAWDSMSRSHWPFWRMSIHFFVSFQPLAQTCFTKNSGRLFWRTKHLSLYTLTSVCIFSSLFFIHFQRCWQGKFVCQLKGSFSRDHFFLFSWP